MNYDPVRRALLIAVDELEDLTGLVAAGADPAVIDRWLDAELTETVLVAFDRSQDTGHEKPSETTTALAHPTMAGIAALLAQPDRTITIERFANDHVTPLFIHWDRHGRCILVEPNTAPGANTSTDPEPGPDDGYEGTIQITATRMNLLPGLLSHALRINPDATTSAHEPITTTASMIEQALAPADPGDAPENDDAADASDGLNVVLADLTEAWRATAAWRSAHPQQEHPGQHATQEPSDPNTTLTVFHGRSNGFWVFEHDAAELGATPAPATTVRLAPASPTTVIARLGDVITGRKWPQPGATEQPYELTSY